jgi:hypothetical protein
LAEAVVVVCDSCGAPAVDTVSIRARGKAFQKDLCERHLKDLVANARPARRGRPRSKTSKGASPKRTPRKASKTRAKKKATRKRAA